MRNSYPIKKLTVIMREIKTIFPFTQQPPLEKVEELQKQKQPDPSELFSHVGSELFSRFTADIIKEEVVFTR
jgi:hypothetical protein